MEMIGKKYLESIKYGRVLLLKRRDNEYWYVKYRLPDSPKWIERSLKTSLKRDAEKHADHLNAQIVNKSLGVADGSALIAILFERYFTAENWRISLESVKRFTSSRHNLERWLVLKYPDIKLIKHLKPSLVREFQNYRLDESGSSMRTGNNDITNLHTIFKWGEREGLVAKSPFCYSNKMGGTVRLWKLPKTNPDTYSKAEYALLVQAADQAGDILIRDLIIVLADTGLRFGELSHLTAKSLFWDNDPPYIDIRARDGWKPKDPDEIKQVPMTVPVQEVLRRRQAKAGRSYLFKNEAGNHIAENHTLERLKSYFPAVGITPDRHLYWHRWRNYFVIRRLEDGEPVHRVMQWTGHDSESMVLRYAKALSKRLEGVAGFKNQIPSMGKI